MTIKRKTQFERTLLALGVLLILASSALNYITNNKGFTGTLDEFTVYLNERIPELMDYYAIPGVTVALIHEGETAWTNAYGYANSGERQLMTINTILMAQSISKSVTSWGVMKLVEDGLIGLDDPVMDHITSWKFPESDFSESGVTVRRLLSHTAAMPLGDFGVVFLPEEDIPSLLVTLSGEEGTLVEKPGSSFTYSNRGYTLLELLVEEVTGRDFAEYMEKEILVPLGMYNSSFAWNEKFRSRISSGHDLSGKIVPAYLYPDKASGGLFSNTEDLAAFASAGMLNLETAAGRGILLPESVKQLYDPNVQIPGIYGIVSESYGLGHFLEILPSGHQAVWHGGQGNGWMTHFHSVPKTGDGIVILTNSQRSWPFFAYVLSDWAHWSGFESVGFGLFILGKSALQVFVGLLFLISLAQIWKLVWGIASAQRKIAPLLHRSRAVQFGQFGLFIGLTAVLGWSVRQDYLIVTSVYPILAKWLGFALFFIALVSLASACVPVVTENDKAPNASV